LILAFKKILTPEYENTRNRMLRSEANTVDLVMHVVNIHVDIKLYMFVSYLYLNLF